MLEKRAHGCQKQEMQTLHRATMTMWNPAFLGVLGIGAMIVKYNKIEKTFFSFGEAVGLCICDEMDNAKWPTDLEELARLHATRKNDYETFMKASLSRCEEKVSGEQRWPQGHLDTLKRLKPTLGSREQHKPTAWDPPSSDTNRIQFTSAPAPIKRQGQQRD